jgi:hypothetical protein
MPTLPPECFAFVYGFVGSIAVEVVLILQVMGPNGGMPGRYKTRFFWGVRIVLGLISGLIATAYYSPHLPMYLYVHLGAATPAILTSVSRIGEDEQPKEGAAPT